MSNYSQTFNWVQFPEGRARFEGLCRCWDEQGRETFALELRGNEYFGEIKRSYLDNENDYNIEIHSFGYGRGEDVGMPGIADVDRLGIGVREVFTPQEENMARTLVIQLVHAGLKYDLPPSPLKQNDASHFMGNIAFHDDWMLLIQSRFGVVQ